MVCENRSQDLINVCTCAPKFVDGVSIMTALDTVWWRPSAIYMYMTVTCASVEAAHVHVHKCTCTMYTCSRNVLHLVSFN